MFLLFADVCIILHVMGVSMSECGESHDEASAGGDMLPDREWSPLASSAHSYDIRVVVLQASETWPMWKSTTLTRNS